MDKVDASLNLSRTVLDRFFLLVSGGGISFGLEWAIEKRTS